MAGMVNRHLTLRCSGKKPVSAIGYSETRPTIPASRLRRRRCSIRKGFAATLSISSAVAFSMRASRPSTPSNHGMPTYTQ